MFKNNSRLDFTDYFTAILVRDSWVVGIFRAAVHVGRILDEEGRAGLGVVGRERRSQSAATPSQEVEIVICRKRAVSR